MNDFYEIPSYKMTLEQARQAVKELRMKLVIDIPEETYNLITTHWKKPKYIGAERLIYEWITEGTPLPKGHGRLIDADEILKAMNTWDKFGYTETGCFVKEPCNDYAQYVHYEDMVKSVNGTPTIIEADKESEDKE